MNKVYTILLFLFLGSTVLLAQQEPQYTQFMHTKQLFNPAYVGAKGVPCIKGLHRSQWIGFKGAPVSQALMFNMPFFDPRVGFGLNLQHYTIGIIENWEADLAYSYDLMPADDFSIRVGIMGSIRQFGLDFSDPDLFIRNINDASITNGENYNTLEGDVGVGLYIDYEGYYFGVSVPNILPNIIGQGDNQLLMATEEPHFYAMAGGLIPLSDSKLSIYPNALLKYVKDAPWTLGLNLSLMYDSRFSFGASYRLSNENSDSVDVLFQFQANDKFGFGISYDYPLFEVQDHTSGSIEVMLDYCLGSKSPDMSNPRFFF